MSHLAVAPVSIGGSGALLSGAAFLHRAEQRRVCAGQERAAQAPLGWACGCRAGLVPLLPAQQLALQLLHCGIWLGRHLAGAESH